MHEPSDTPFAITPSLWVGRCAPRGVNCVSVIVPGETEEAAVYASTVLSVVREVVALVIDSADPIKIKAPGTSPVVVVESVEQAANVLRLFGLPEDKVQDRIWEVERKEGFHGGKV